MASKFQTGFDQPKLVAMVVDKKFSGVACVQTLSCLNRTTAGKEDTFVLDFENTAEDIEKGFQPFYDRVTLPVRGGEGGEVVKRILNKYATRPTCRRKR